MDLLVTFATAGEAMSDKKLWKQVGKLALEKAVETVVEEGVEAAVEVWKKYRLKLQSEWFEQRKKRREAENSNESGGDRERQAYPGAGDPGEADGADGDSGDSRERENDWEDADRDGGNDEPEAAGASAEPFYRQSVSNGTELESFDAFVGRRRDE